MLFYLLEKDEMGGNSETLVSSYGPGKNQKGLSPRIHFLKSSESEQLLGGVPNWTNTHSTLQHTFHYHYCFGLKCQQLILVFQTNFDLLHQDC